jgi:adenylate cyclase
MGLSSRPSIQIDLNEFKLHLHLKSRIQLTLHFDSPSRSFYLCVIALVVNEMKKLGKIKSIPLQEHLDLLVLLNETIGGSAGSSEKEHLLHRIYRKWKDGLPNLEEAPLFKVLGKKKEEGDGAIGKIYSFTDAEKDGWANLFEYMGSNQNVRLKFALDKMGVSLEETSIIFGDSLNGNAWDQFISSLEKGRKEESEPVEEKVVPKPPAVPFSPPQERKITWFSRYRWVMLAVVIGVAAGVVWRIYLSPAPIRVASVDLMQDPLPDRPSIAVLPFANLSEDPKQEFLGDGITESIITSLSKLPWMFVIARQSTLIYKGKHVNAKQVSDELGVRYVLEGSVQRSADRIRITAQLIDALKGHHLWAERYDRGLKDIFTLQDEITMKILTELRVKLTDGEAARIYMRGTNNLEAYLKVLEGDGYMRSYNKEANAVGIRLYQEAIDLDPGYAMPYIRLSRAYTAEVYYRPRESPEEKLSKAVKSAEKAIELDGSLAEGHAALGYALLTMRQHDKAIEVSERAVSLNPNSATALFTLAQCMHFSGRWKEGLSLLRQAIRLNPYVPIYYSYFATACRETGRYEEGINALKKSLTFAPNDLFAHINLVALYMYAEREDEARAAVAEIKRIAPNFSLTRYRKAQPWKESVDTSRVFEAMGKAGLE